MRESGPDSVRRRFVDGTLVDAGGLQLQPELAEAPTRAAPEPAGDDLVVLDDDDVPWSGRDTVERQMSRTARLAALDPDDGIAL